jgi:ATP-dependent helicase HrpA
MGAAPPPAPGGPDSGDSDTPPTNGAALHRQLTTGHHLQWFAGWQAARDARGPTPRIAAARRESGRAALLPISYPDLPVAERRDEIAAAIRDHQVVIVAGETGSGKTTQLPKICLELGRGVAGLIGHTQPRRLAARTVADRIAEELGVELGGAVGYSVRFTDNAGADTLVRLMTDGILLAEIQRDRDLRRYDTIIIDEAHERSLNIDFLLGYLKQLLPRRPDLKLVVTSATIDTARFAGALRRRAGRWR